MRRWTSWSSEAMSDPAAAELGQHVARAEADEDRRDRVALHGRAEIADPAVEAGARALRHIARAIGGRVDRGVQAVGDLVCALVEVLAEVRTEIVARSFDRH